MTRSLQPRTGSLVQAQPRCGDSDRHSAAPSLRRTRQLNRLGAGGNPSLSRPTLAHLLSLSLQPPTPPPHLRLQLQPPLPFISHPNPGPPARLCTFPSLSAPPLRPPRTLLPSSPGTHSPQPPPSTPSPCVSFCAAAFQSSSAPSFLRRKPRLPADAGVPGGVFLCLCSPPSLSGSPRPSLTTSAPAWARGAGAALGSRLFLLSGRALAPPARCRRRSRLCRGLSSWDPPPRAQLSPGRRAARLQSPSDQPLPGCRAGRIRGCGTTNAGSGKAEHSWSPAESCRSLWPRP